MTDLRFFMGLLDLVSSAEEELGLNGLSQKDKQVLKVFWDSKDINNEVNLTYQEFCQRHAFAIISRAQYFKSIQKVFFK